MTSLLNKGLNFCLVPKRVNTTGILAGFDRMSRSMIWKERIFTDNDLEEEVLNSFISAPWKPIKTNLPNKGPSSDLKTFLNGSLSCVLGSTLNRIHTNLPENERRAMFELIKLQKSRVITIKPNDKNGGTSILRTCDYIGNLEHLLNSKHIDKNGFEHNYFAKLEHYTADQLQFNHWVKLKEEVDKAKSLGYIESGVARGWSPMNQPQEDFTDW